MSNEASNLKFYNLHVEFNAENNNREESGYIATEVNKKTIDKRLAESSAIEKFELKSVKEEDIKFPVNLIEVNQLYDSLEDLQKDYMVLKLSGVI